MQPQYIVAGIFIAVFFMSIILKGLEVRSITKSANLQSDDFRTLLFRIFEFCAGEVVANVFLCKSIIMVCWEYAEICIILELIALLILFVHFPTVLEYVCWDIGLILLKIITFIIFMPFFRRYILKHTNQILGFSQESIKLIRIRNLYKATRTMFYMINVVIYGYFTFESSLIWLFAVYVLIIMNLFLETCDDMESLEIKLIELIYSQAVFTLSLLHIT